VNHRDVSIGTFSVTLKKEGIENTEGQMLFRRRVGNKIIVGGIVQQRLFNTEKTGDTEDTEGAMCLMGEE